MAGLLAKSGRRCLSWRHLSPSLALLAHLPQAEQARAAGLAQQLQASNQAAQQAQEEAQHSAAELQEAQVRGGGSQAGCGRSIERGRGRQWAASQLMRSHKTPKTLCVQAELQAANEQLEVGL